MLLDNVPFDDRYCENTELYYMHVVIRTLFYYTIRITPKISINCSNPTTVIQSDNFACECKGNGNSHIEPNRNGSRSVARKYMFCLVGRF